METWPTTFPVPDDTFNIDTKPSSKRGKLDGLRTQNDRWKMEHRKIGVLFTMTDFIYEVFQQWHNKRIARGNAWFNMDLPLGKGFQSYVVKIIKGEFDADDEPVGHWKVKVPLEVEEKNYDDAATAMIEGVDFSVSVGLTEFTREHWVEHTEGVDFSVTVNLTEVSV